MNAQKTHMTVIRPVSMFLGHLCVIVTVDTDFTLMENHASVYTHMVDICLVTGILGGEPPTYY